MKLVVVIWNDDVMVMHDDDNDVDLDNDDDGDNYDGGRKP